LSELQTDIKILLVEGKRTDRPSFLYGLTKKNYHVDSVPSGSAALAHMDEEIPNIVIVDAASMRTSGKRICTSIKNKAPALPLVLIVDENANPVALVDADVILQMPFTPQKLLNRIKPYLPQEPKNVIKVGPIHLDVQRRSVYCNDRQCSLTPRLVILLKALMDEPGKVIVRETLFSKVWETEYTDDTRTLDVHVSWLRQAIEDDPRHPRYIKTVRGVGYRLDLDERKPSVNGRDPRRK
jgi:DNA-binding response OmpR family regulator